MCQRDRDMVCCALRLDFQACKGQEEGHNVNAGFPLGQARTIPCKIRHQTHHFREITPFRFRREQSHLFISDEKF